MLKAYRFRYLSIEYEVRSLRMCILVWKEMVARARRGVQASYCNILWGRLTRRHKILFYFRSSYGGCRHNDLGLMCRKFAQNTSSFHIDRNSSWSVIVAQERWRSAWNLSATAILLRWFLFEVLTADRREFFILKLAWVKPTNGYFSQ